MRATLAMGCLLLSAGGARADVPAAHRWVLLRTPVTLSALHGSADAGVSLRTPKKPWWEEHEVLVPVHFIADRGETLEVETAGSAPEPISFCVPVWGGGDGCSPHELSGYRLHGMVPKSRAVLVTRDSIDLQYRDGTGAHLQPGLPAEPEALADGGTLFRFRGRLARENSFSRQEARDFTLALDAGLLGVDFQLASTHEVSSWSSTGSHFLREDSALRLGTSSIERLDGDAWIPERDVEMHGRTALVKLKDRCDVLTVRVPTRALVRPARDTGIVGGIAGEAIDGHVLCTDESQWLVRGGAPVFWPSGEPAGEVTADDGFLTEPHRVGGLLCFSERLQLVANEEALCLAPNDVVRAPPGQTKRGVVPACPACPAGRADATAKALVHLPNWAVPSDAGLALSVGCDVTGSGKLACCDMPPIEQVSEVTLRRALYDTTSPVRPDGGDFLRVEVLLIH